jgi:hypothetical protein
MVREKNEQTSQYDAVATPDFRNEQLTGVTRTWVNNWDVGSAKVAKNLYFLVKWLEESGQTKCTLGSKAQDSPDFETKYSVLHCGNKTVAKHKLGRRIPAD